MSFARTGLLSYILPTSIYDWFWPSETKTSTVDSSSISPAASAFTQEKVEEYIKASAAKEVETIREKKEVAARMAKVTVEKALENAMRTVVQQSRGSTPASSSSSPDSLTNSVSSSAHIVGKIKEQIPAIKAHVSVATEQNFFHELDEEEVGVLIHSITDSWSSNVNQDMEEVNENESYLLISPRP